jgi:tetratricopeptide (TPR) repeat protein
MYQYRLETYYRNDIIFKELEEIFNEDSFSLTIPRFVGNVTEKTYKNTVDLLGYCVQFAVNGVLRTWLLDEGKILAYSMLEPESDKAAVQHYLKGRSLVKEKGKQAQALNDLSKAIEMHDRHAQAYERRAKTNLILQNRHDALRDYTKAINIDPSMPSAYFGRGRVHFLNEEYDKAITDFDMAIKKSVALESIHWKCRRFKGICHLKNKEYEKASFELKLFTKRKFKSGDKNLFWKRWGFFNYGKVLLELEDYNEALDCFNEAFKFQDIEDGIRKREILRYKGISKQLAGKNGHVKDLTEAAELGDKIAAQILKDKRKKK